MDNIRDNITDNITDNIRYKILNPFKNKKIFIIEYEDIINDIYFTKIIKYSLTKEYNELLTEEYNKYQIVSKNNLSLKYNFENFNQIITLNNVVFDSNIDLNIMNNDISYPIILDTTFLNINKNDIDYYDEDNISEDEDQENKKNKYKKIKYKFKSIKFTIKKMCFIVCDYNYRKITFDKILYDKSYDYNFELFTIKKILNNLEILYEEQHFIHGDLKCDNILLLNNDNVIPYFYDLEFSILFKQNTIKIISHCNPRVNLYLNLKPNFVLIKDFLHIFDYYLLTMSVISYHNNMNKINNFILFVDKYILKENDAKILLFLYLYDKINYYFNKNNINITVNTMLDYCEYDTIHKILNDSYNVNFSYIEKNIKYMYDEINDLNK
jgi:hypothetical protein